MKAFNKLQQVINGRTFTFPDEAKDSGFILDHNSRFTTHVTKYLSNFYGIMNYRDVVYGADLTTRDSQRVKSL